MRNLILIIPFFGLSYSCHKLDENESELIGEWEWVYTEIKHNTCDNSQYWYTYISPETENKSFEFHLLKNGRIHLFENNEIILNKKLKTSSVNLDLHSSPVQPHHFTLRFNGSEYTKLNGSFGLDSLVDGGFFPFRDEDEECKDFRNFFARK